ncbi:hypothetical protein EJB05_36079, partial [Eragrostis curvula]
MSICTLLYSKGVHNVYVYKLLRTSPRECSLAGAVQDTPSSKLYAMIQCTRDISSDDCNLCINSIPEAVPYYCDTKGSRASAGCSARAALFEFYDAQAVQAVMPPPPTPARGTREVRPWHHSEFYQETFQSLGRNNQGCSMYAFTLICVFISVVNEGEIPTGVDFFRDQMSLCSNILEKIGYSLLTCRP